MISFFFSSRRRHTRWPRDWSSDVCSSDLYQRCRRYVCDLDNGGNAGIADRPDLLSKPVSTTLRARSEERRVGKECRARGGSEQEKRKGKRMEEEIRTETDSAAYEVKSDGA